MALECLVALEKVLRLARDKRDIGAECILGETEFDELDYAVSIFTADYGASQRELPTFFCSMSFELGQSYTTSLPNTGPQSGL